MCQYSPPLAVAIIRGDKTFLWDGESYVAKDGERIEATDARTQAAIRTAQTRVARRMLEALLDDEVTLADLPQPGQIQTLPWHVGAFDSPDVERAARSLIAAAQENGNWGSIGLLRLAASIGAKGPVPFAARGWACFDELSCWLQDLAAREMIVLWGDRLHFTRAFVLRMAEYYAVRREGIQLAVAA